MKNLLFKFYIPACLLLLVAVSSGAQIKKPGITLGGNVIYAMPQGIFQKGYSYGFGGEAYGGVGLGSTYLIATVGVTSYKPQANNGVNLTAIPVKVGLKNYFLLKKFFINADAGVATIKNGSASGSVFTAGLGAGVRLLGLEAGLYYNTFGNLYDDGYSNSLHAKLGWSFSL